MKNPSLFIFTFFIVLIGCKKTSNQSNVPSIIGKWYKTKDILRQSFNGVNYTSDTITRSNPNIYIMFNVDGTGLESDTAGTNSFNYKLNGSQLTFIPGDGVSTYTIEALTSSGFTIHDVFAYPNGNSTVSGYNDIYYTK